MAADITLRNGVWIHETEWAAIKELIGAVDKWQASDEEHSYAYQLEVEDAYNGWRTVHMDIAEETRAIQTLTKIVDDLSESVSDVSSS